MTPIVTTISLARHRMRDPRQILTLPGFGLLVSLSIALAFAAYTQAKPNTPGLAPGGEFDANRAFADLRCLASFGPRPPASQALEHSREFMAGELRAAGATVALDSFTASTPLGPIPMTNLVAKIPSTSSAVVIIAGHYDTKRIDFPFVGANDGGSSAAFLLEMARVLARRGNTVAYWPVFFDGEEALQRWSNTDGLPFNLYWHTRYDTVDKCNPASLAIVARVVLATLAALETTLPSRPGGASQ